MRASASSYCLPIPRKRPVLFPAVRPTCLLTTCCCHLMKRRWPRAVVRTSIPNLNGKQNGTAPLQNQPSESKDSKTSVNGQEKEQKTAQMIWIPLPCRLSCLHEVQMLVLWTPPAYHVRNRYLVLRRCKDKERC